MASVSLGLEHFIQCQWASTARIDMLSSWDGFGLANWCQQWVWFAFCSCDDSQLGWQLGLRLQLLSKLWVCQPPTRCRLPAVGFRVHCMSALRVCTSSRESAMGLPSECCWTGTYSTNVGTGVLVGTECAA